MESYVITIDSDDFIYQFAIYRIDHLVKNTSQVMKYIYLSNLNNRQKFSLKKMSLEMSFVKRWPSCLGLNVLIITTSQYST